MLGESNLKWEDYLAMNKEQRIKWENKANKLGKRMMFVFGCRNKEVQKNLKRMSADNQEQYLQNIEIACHIYQT